MPIAATLVALALGLGLFLVGLKQRRTLRASLNWPQVTGTVTATQIEQGETGNSEDGYSATFTPYVHYRYEVNGAQFAGSRLAICVRSYASSKQAQKQIAAYEGTLPSPCTSIRRSRRKRCWCARRPAAISCCMWERGSFCWLCSACCASVSRGGISVQPVGCDGNSEQRRPHHCQPDLAGQSRSGLIVGTGRKPVDQRANAISQPAQRSGNQSQ